PDLVGGGSARNREVEPHRLRAMLPRPHVRPLKRLGVGWCGENDNDRGECERPLCHPEPGEHREPVSKDQREAMRLRSAASRQIAPRRSFANAPRGLVSSAPLRFAWCAALRMTDKRLTHFESLAPLAMRTSQTPLLGSASLRLVLEIRAGGEDVDFI